MVELSSDRIVSRLVNRLGESDLVNWFLPEGRNRNLVGLEIECGLVRPESGSSIGYDEPFGSRALLETLRDTAGGEPILEGSYLIGVRLPDGSAVTLEMAGAIEYSSPPVPSLTEALALAKVSLVRLAQLAEPLGIRLLTGGILPFDDQDDIKWAPKPRTTIMRQHFRNLGDAGSRGDHVMGLTLSTQVSLDALTAAEYLEKLRVMLAVSPFVSAFLSNTPPLRDNGTSVASRRMLYWRKIDPARCQILTERIFAARSIEEVVEALTSLPMIYRRLGNSVAQAPNVSFARLMAEGFGDGTVPVLADWESHLSQLWPVVRPRRTLETRLPDGQSWANFDVVPALWVGLAEEPGIRRRVLEVVGALPASALDSIAMRAAEHGLAGLDDPVREHCLALLELAREGLALRSARGAELPSAATAVDTVHDLVASGRTMASGLLEKWTGEWRRQPARYVSAMSVPTDDS